MYIFTKFQWVTKDDCACSCDCLDYEDVLILIMVSQWFASVVIKPETMVLASEFQCYTLYRLVAYEHR
jgi:hypothetical protein